MWLAAHTDVTLSRAHAPLTQDQAWVDKVNDQLRGNNKARLDWFGFVNSKLIL